MGCAIPIMITYASYLFPDTGPESGLTFMDIARQTYPNILFLVIAVSGIAIAEALMLFFRMVEVGEAKATPALWLLTLVLLIVFSSISYARIMGGNFDPERVSDQQLYLAVGGAFIAIIAALALRLSVMKLEQIARQHVHDNAVVSTLEEIRDSQADQLDLYDFSHYTTNDSEEDGGKEEENDEIAKAKKALTRRSVAPIKRPEPPSERKTPFFTSGSASTVTASSAADEEDTEEDPVEEKPVVAKGPVPKMPAFDLTADESAEDEEPEEEAEATEALETNPVEDIVKDFENAADEEPISAPEPEVAEAVEAVKKPEPEPAKPVRAKPAREEAKEKAETVPASKSIAKNRRFTRRSSGSRIKKPRSKDAKV